MSGATDAEILRLKSGKSPIFFACFNCESTVHHDSENSRLFDVDEKVAALTKQLKGELTKTRSAVKILTKEKAEQEAARKDIERRQLLIMEQNKQKTDEKSKKRRRTEMINNNDENDDSDTSMNTENTDQI